jgi:iron(III) transport system permease protein
VLAALATFACAAPAAAVMIQALIAPRAGGGDAGRFWIDSVAGTLALMIAGGGVAIALGIAAAWLVAMCRFPGRPIFEWLLVLPLALPVYVLAYAYGGIAGPGGPSPLRVAGPSGAAFVYALGLYPYIYLAARAAFVSQSACVLEAARTLGARPWRAFWAVALPAARPAIVAGAALALMEIAADYGAASYYGATTITTGVFRAWFSRGDPALAMQLAATLLIAAALALAAERRARGRAAYGAARWRALPRYRLPLLAALGAALSCGLLAALGAILPLAWLARSALLAPPGAIAALAPALSHSLMLAIGGGGATLLLSAIVALAARAGGRAGQAALLAAASGYAAPGAVIALGALAIAASLRGLGLIGGLTGAVAIAALIWTYAARFAAAGAQPIEAGLTRITPAISGAAKTLGAGAFRRALAVELPLAAPGAFAAALIVFVEILKELPATLILRPFDFDTLAVKANEYASDDRLIQAAAPSLLIALVGVLPIVLLSRGLSRARAGGP